MAQWEKGTTSPAESRLRDLARVFEVSVADFYRGPAKAPKASKAAG